MTAPVPSPTLCHEKAVAGPRERQDVQDSAQPQSRIHGHEEANLVKGRRRARSGRASHTKHFFPRPPASRLEPRPGPGIRKRAGAADRYFSGSPAESSKVRSLEMSCPARPFLPQRISAGGSGLDGGVQKNFPPARHQSAILFRLQKRVLWDV